MLGYRATWILNQGTGFCSSTRAQPAAGRSASRASASLMSRKLVRPPPCRQVSLVRVDQRNVHDMLRQEPDLLFVGSDDVRDQEVVRPVVPRVRRLVRHRARLLQQDLVGVEESR